MFEWKDYGESSALFISGVEENVALLRYKDFRLTDSATSFKVKMKSNNIVDAKTEAIDYLIARWEQVSKEIERNLRMIKEKEEE